jgi:hypothetical protein
LVLSGSRATVYFARPEEQPERPTVAGAPQVAPPSEPLGVILTRRRLLASEIALLVHGMVGKVANPLLDLADQFPPSGLPVAVAEYFVPPADPPVPVQMELYVDLIPDRYALLAQYADDMRLGLVHQLRDVLRGFGGAAERAHVGYARVSLRLDTLYTAVLMPHSSVIMHAEGGDVARLHRFKLPETPYKGLPPSHE